MLPKERVIAATQHRQPDRVPIGEMGVDYPITEQALGHPTLYRAKWKEYQALWQGRRDEYVASCQQDLVALARKFDWDFVPVIMAPRAGEPPRPPQFLDEYTWLEPDGRVMRFSPDSEGHAVPIQVPPLAERNLESKPLVIDPSQLDIARNVVAELGATHFIVGRGEDGTFPHEKYGLTELLMGMVDDPKRVQRAIELEVERSITINRALLDAGCDAVVVGDDYCSTKGPMMSPRHFRRFILPALKALCQDVHARGKYFIKHTDGNLWPIFDMLMEAGIDGWHGIQTMAGMDLARLKAQYGDRLCFWGGVDVDYLIDGDPEQVRAVTRQAIEQAGTGGGLVLASGNSLMVGVRYENYQAMLDVAHNSYFPQVALFAVF